MARSWMKVSFVRIVGGVLAVLTLASATRSETPELWFSPNVRADGSSDQIARFFSEPKSWQKLASSLTGVSLPVNYLIRSPKLEIQAEMEWLEDHHLMLNVSLPILPVDKNVCGNKIEGMIWPGEATVMAKRLKNRNVNVYSFGLDLPLTNGSIARNPGACSLSVDETAKRLATSVAELRVFYPSAMIVDTEVPTGMPASKWSRILTEWLSDFKKTSGKNFDALVLDVWWSSDWKDASAATVKILRSSLILPGIILNSDGNDHASPADWVQDARRNGCQILGFQFGLVGIANWLDGRVRDLPEDNADTLANLAKWFSEQLHRSTQDCEAN